MTTSLATVDLGRTAHGVWHILADDETTRCSLALDPEHAIYERGLDAHVFQHKGRNVCARCRGTARYFTGARL